jgi:hypothetical protein
MFGILKHSPDPIEDPITPPQPDLDTPFTMFELYHAFRRNKTGGAAGAVNCLGNTTTPSTPSQEIIPPRSLQWLPVVGRRPWSLETQQSRHDLKRHSQEQQISIQLSRHFSSKLHLQSLCPVWSNNASPIPNAPYAPPLLLLRRLTEIFERHSTPLYILFLDWSQAFDSIGHQHLAAALPRYGIPPFLVQASNDVSLPEC